MAEVHPAVAIWQWCFESRANDTDWSSKKSKKVPADIVDIILSRSDLDVPRPSNDDELNALVAWLLGMGWIAGRGNVVQYGNHGAGSFLLPRSDALDTAISGFLDAL